jgi:DNA-binding response OmpR family regulator
MANLLLVDDEPDLLDVIAEVLRKGGHDVLGCTSGLEAKVRIAGPTTLDLAIIDWSLPDVGGRDLMLDLQARQPQAHIIVVTGHGESVVSSNLAKGSVAAVLRKPFRMRELLSLVERTLSLP